MSQRGGVAQKVKTLQQQGIFNMQHVYVEFEEGMCQVSAEELSAEDETCLIQVCMTEKTRYEDEIEEVEETALPKQVKT